MLDKVKFNRKPKMYADSNFLLPFNQIKQEQE